MYFLENVLTVVKQQQLEDSYAKVKLEFIVPDNLMVNVSKSEKQWQI